VASIGQHHVLLGQQVLHALLRDDVLNLQGEGPQRHTHPVMMGGHGKTHQVIHLRVEDVLASSESKARAQACDLQDVNADEQQKNK